MGLEFTHRRKNKMHEPLIFYADLTPLFNTKEAQWARDGNMQFAPAGQFPTPSGSGTLGVDGLVQSAASSRIVWAQKIDLGNYKTWAFNFWAKFPTLASGLWKNWLCLDSTSIVNVKCGFGTLRRTLAPLGWASALGTTDQHNNIMWGVQPTANVWNYYTFTVKLVSGTTKNFDVKFYVDGVLKGTFLNEPAYPNWDNGSKNQHIRIGSETTDFWNAVIKNYSVYEYFTEDMLTDLVANGGIPKQFR